MVLVVVVVATATFPLYVTLFKPSDNASALSNKRELFLTQFFNNEQQLRFVVQ